MKITLIGSTQYLDKFLRAKRRLEAEGHEVKLPAFDDQSDLNELGIMEYNLEAIKWADEVRVIWDCRSMGTWGDWGMAFALGKPVKIEYLEPKKFENVMKQYFQKVQNG